MQGRGWKGGRAAHGGADGKVGEEGPFLRLVKRGAGEAEGEKGAQRSSTRGCIRSQRPVPPGVTRPTTSRDDEDCNKESRGRT